MATIVEGANGVAFAPELVSLKALSLMGEAEYASCAQWLADQRKGRAERARELEQRQEETAAEIRADVERRAAAREKWAKTPATRGDLP